MSFDNRRPEDRRAETTPSQEREVAGFMLLRSKNVGLLLENTGVFVMPVRESC